MTTEHSHKDRLLAEVARLSGIVEAARRTRRCVDLERALIVAHRMNLSEIDAAGSTPRP